MFSLGTIDRMNAAEVRRRAEIARSKTPSVVGLLEFVLKQIDSAAEAGKFELSDPFGGCRLHASAEEKEKVFEILKSRGYRVAGGRDPRVSWKDAR